MPVREPEGIIPRHLLPPGFAESLEEEPATVAVPRPAATVVLLREGRRGLEVLLLKRIRTAGFVPGAWVFPGGRVDGGDAGPELVARLDGVTEEAAAARLDLATDADPPALAYWVAAIREAFEEAGILLAGDASGDPPPGAGEDAQVQEMRLEVMRSADAFVSVLDRLGTRMAGAALEYIAHWITPLPEPRRYDTRFFAAAVPPGIEALPDPRESAAAVWISPTEALEENRSGRLPMVFPTIHTLRALRPFRDPVEALAAFAARPIPTILPRLVRTREGVGIEVAEIGGGGEEGGRA